MEVGAQVGQLRRPAAEVLVDGTGLQAPQPQTHIPRGGGYSLQQVDEALAVFQIVAPGGYLDTGEHQLTVALAPQLLRLGYGRRQRQGAHRAAGVGDDAVGTEIHTAVLYLQHGPGALGHAAGGQHLEFPAAQGVVQQSHRLLFVGCLLEQVQKRHAVTGTGQQVHVQCRHHLRVGLHITAAGGHHRVGVQLMTPADHLPGFLVTDGGDGAGVDDIAVGLCLGGHQRMTAAQQLLLHGLCLVLVHLAAQGIDGNTHLALSPILSYNKVSRVKVFFTPAF